MKVQLRNAEGCAANLRKELEAARAEVERLTKEREEAKGKCSEHPEFCIWYCCLNSASGDRETAIRRMERAESQLEQARQRMGKLGAAVAFAHMTLEHALELGYLGEGSTMGMAQDALAKLAAALDAGEKEKSE